MWFNYTKVQSVLSINLECNSLQLCHLRKKGFRYRKTVERNGNYLMLNKNKVNMDTNNGKKIQNPYLIINTIYIFNISGISKRQGV